MFQTIKSKTYFGFTLVFLLMLALCIIGVLRVNQINNKLHEINDVNSMKQRYAINFRGSVHDRAIALRDVVLESESNKIKTQLAIIEQLLKFYADSAQPLDNLVYKSAIKDDKEIKALEHIKSIENKTLPLSNKIIELKLSGKTDDAQKLLLEQVRDLYTQWLAAINVLIDLEEEKNKQASSIATTVGEGFVSLMFIVTGLAIALGLLIALTLTRSISKKIKQAESITKKISSGDFTHQSETLEQDEISQIVIGIQTMSNQLSETISRVRETTNIVANTSQEISKGNQDLSHRTEQQAISLESAYSNIKQLKEIANKTLHDTQTSSQLAKTASSVANDGGKIVKQAIVRMQEINDSSSKISDITNMIDSIAFQTNILALNAAVEAARAGEQGKGFAVVASEVRNLAQKSAQAAKEIKELINDSIAKIQDGNSIVQETGNTIQTAVEKIEQVAKLVEEIDNKMKNQNSYVEQIETAMGQLDSVTQQNAAMVEEIAAASTNMEQQSKSLVNDISVFKT